TGNEAQPRVEIRSRRTPSDWTTHASATLERTAQPPVVVGGVDDQGATELDPDELYRRLRSAGQQHGPAFQGIVGLTVFHDGVARAPGPVPAAGKQGGRPGGGGQTGRTPVRRAPRDDGHRPAGTRCDNAGHRARGWAYR